MKKFLSVVAIAALVLGIILGITNANTKDQAGDPPIGLKVKTQDAGSYTTFGDPPIG